MNKKILLLITVMILLAPSALSLGITPGKVTLDFQPGLETTASLTILNNDQKDFTALVLVEGDLEDYVTLEETRLDFAKEDLSKTLSYKVKLPGSLSSPGTHQTMIKVRETKETKENEPILIGASLEVVSLLLVEVPYKGKFVQAKMFISEGEVGEEKIFAIPVKNIGEEDIASIGAKIDVSSMEGEKVATIHTDEKSLSPGSERELIARWTAERPGKYKATALLNYDGKETTLEKEFVIGDFLLKLHDIAVKDFKLGGIAKFQILVENTGNDLIKEAYSRMDLKDEKGKTIMDIESNRKDVKPGENKDLEAYWETENVEKGTYDGEITLKYEDKQKTERIRTTVKDDSIETQILAVTGMAVMPTTKSKSNTAITVLIIVLIAMNIGWFVYFKRRKK